MSDAAKVLAEQIQSLGLDALDFIGGSWDVKITPRFDGTATYKLYSLSGVVLGSVIHLSPDQYTRTAPYAEVWVAINKVGNNRVRPAETAEEYLIKALDYLGCPVVAPVPVLLPWTEGFTEGGGRKSWIRRKRASPGARAFEVSNRENPGVFMLYQNGQYIHTVARNRPELGDDEVRTLVDTWLEDRFVRLADSFAPNRNRGTT